MTYLSLHLSQCQFLLIQLINALDLRLLHLVCVLVQPALRLVKITLKRLHLEIAHSCSLIPLCALPEGELQAPSPKLTKLLVRILLRLSLTTQIIDLTLLLCLVALSRSIVLQLILRLPLHDLVWLSELILDLLSLPSLHLLLLKQLHKLLLIELVLITHLLN